MDLSPKEIADVAIEKGIAKANSSFLSMVVLGFLGGAFIAIGYLAYIRVTGTMPESWGSFDTFMGAAVFPTGLILILVGGGELVTGNMMAVSMACFDKKINILQLIWNWLWITIFNLIGALFVAYYRPDRRGFFGENRPHGRNEDERAFLAGICLRDRLQLACQHGGLALLRRQNVCRQNHRHLVSDHGFCADRVPARRCQYVHYSGRYFCGASFMDVIFEKYHRGFPRKCGRRSCVRQHALLYRI